MQKQRPYCTFWFSSSYQIILDKPKPSNINQLWAVNQDSSMIGQGRNMLPSPTVTLMMEFFGLTSLLCTIVKVMVHIQGMQKSKGNKVLNCLIQKGQLTRTGHENKLKLVCMHHQTCTCLNQLRKVPIHFSDILVV